MIKRLIATWRMRRADAAYDRGFAWAAGLMLSTDHEGTVQRLLNNRRSVDFVIGAQDACAAYRGLKRYQVKYEHIRSCVPTLVKQLEH